MIICLLLLKSCRIGQPFSFTFPLAILINLNVLKIELVEDALLEIRFFLYRRCDIVVKRLGSILPYHFFQNDHDDLLQTAYEFVSNPELFLVGFDESLYSKTDYLPILISWVDCKLKRSLLPSLRKIAGDETIGRTNLGLMSRSSYRKIKIALQNLGFRESLLSQYLLAFQCFSEVKNSLNLPVNKYKEEQFKLIANRYNKLKPNNFGENIDEKKIQIWLEEMGSAIRRLLAPPKISLDSSLEKVKIMSLSEPNLLTLDELNFLESLTQLKKYIYSILHQLEPEDNKLLLFYYGYKKDQQQIAQELCKNQSTISRRIKKLNLEIIFPKICEWIKTNIKFEANFETISDEALKELKAVLNEYYEKLI